MTSNQRMDALDSKVETEALNSNLMRLKSTLKPCVTKNSLDSLPRVVPVHYSDSASSFQVHGFRNLHLKQFCGVTCLYSIALKLLALNKNKFFVQDNLAVEDKINLCIEEVNKVMISQAGEINLLNLSYILITPNWFIIRKA